MNTSWTNEVIPETQEHFNIKNKISIIQHIDNKNKNYLFISLVEEKAFD